MIRLLFFAPALLFSAALGGGMVHDLAPVGEKLADIPAIEVRINHVVGLHEETVAERLQRTVVRVEVSDGSGSGIAFRAADGSVFVWTAAHVVRDLRQEDGTYPTVRVIAMDDRPAPATVVRVSPDHDVALLRVQENILVRSAVFHSGDRPRVGTHVYSAGNPLGHFCTVTEGIISFNGRPGVRGQVHDQCSAPSGPGSSGGAVALREDGRILGIVTHGTPHSFVYYVPTWIIREYATQAGVTFALDNTVPVPADLGPVEGPHADR